MLLLFSFWLRSSGRLLGASVLLVLVCAAHWLARRWQVEERHPRPETSTHRRDYRVLQGVEIAGIVALLAWWFAWSERPGFIWVAVAGFVVGAIGGWWWIERAYRRLFQRIASEAPAVRR